MKFKCSSKNCVKETVNKIINGDFPKEFKKIAKKVEEREKLLKKEIVYLLSLKERHIIQALFKLARCVRDENVGDTVFVRGIVEFSNYCRRNCAYCGIRAQNIIKRYRMSPDEIVNAAIYASRFGVDTVILQSGEDPFYAVDTLVWIVKEIKRRTSKTVTLSIGEREIRELKMLKEAGASRYLLKQESVNRKVFEKVHGEDYEKRLSLLRELASIGYEIGGGDIIGLPLQTIEDVAEDVLFLREIGAKMAGIGPLIPTKGTPLESYPMGSIDLTLKAYACTRLVIPNIFLPSTTALGTVNEKFQLAGFDAGCNVIMINFTPRKYEKGYNIYDNKRRTTFYETIEALLKHGERLPPEVIDVFKGLKRSKYF